MFFSRKKKEEKEKPPISNEKKFIVWLLKYLDAPDIKMIRKFLKKSDIDGHLDKMAKEIVENLNEHSSEGKLLDFLAQIDLSYKACGVLIEKRGGFWKSPIEIQVTFFQLLSKLITLPYFINYKYGINLPLLDFKLPEYEDL